MKRIQITTCILIVMFLMCSCNSKDSGKEESTAMPSSDYTEETLIPPSSNETDETTEAEDYEINSVDSDMRFDDWVEYVTDRFDMEYYDPFVDTDLGYRDDMARYFHDYSQQVASQQQLEIEYEQPGRVAEYEYYVTRAYWDSTNEIIIQEFTDDEHAMLHFRETVDYCIACSKAYPDGYLNANYASDGSFISLYNDYSFCATFLFGNTIVSFGINLSIRGTAPYIEYLIISNELGLPTSSDITNQILS